MTKSSALKASCRLKRGSLHARSSACPSARRCSISRNWIDHIAELGELVGSELHLAGIPEIKRKHFAAEARVLDASELRKFRPAKRYAVLVCLIHCGPVRPDP